MIIFRETKRNQIKCLKDTVISLKDRLSVLEQQVNDLHTHQKDIVNTFNQHQHSKGSQYSCKTRVPDVYITYCDD